MAKATRGKVLRGARIQTDRAIDYKQLIIDNEFHRILVHIPMKKACGSLCSNNNPCENLRGKKKRKRSSQSMRWIDLGEETEAFVLLERTHFNVSRIVFPIRRCYNLDWCLSRALVPVSSWLRNKLSPVRRKLDERRGTALTCVSSCSSSFDSFSSPWSKFPSRFMNLRKHKILFLCFT